MNSVCLARRRLCRVLRPGHRPSACSFTAGAADRDDTAHGAAGCCAPARRRWSGRPSPRRRRCPRRQARDRPGSGTDGPVPAGPGMMRTPSWRPRPEPVATPPYITATTGRISANAPGSTASSSCGASASFFQNFTADLRRVTLIGYSGHQDIIITAGTRGEVLGRTNWPMRHRKNSPLTRSFALTSLPVVCR